MTLLLLLMVGHGDQRVLGQGRRGERRGWGAGLGQ